MGYLDNTCASTASSYGPTAGPVLRGDKRYAQWTFTVVGQSPKGNDLVTMETSYPGGSGKPR
jgi:hypothetical protein